MKWTFLCVTPLYNDPASPTLIPIEYRDNLPYDERAFENLNHIFGNLAADSGDVVSDSKSSNSPDGGKNRASDKAPKPDISKSQELLGFSTIVEPRSVVVSPTGD